MGSPSPPTPPTPPTPESDGETPSPNPGPQEPGNAADKESEATSTIDVPREKWRQGKPLSAQGIDLKTRRPQIPDLKWFTLRPSAHPEVEIAFLRTGKPAQATLMSSSGDRELDDYIRDSLYRWRASGKRIRELQGDETAVIRLKLLMN